MLRQRFKGCITPAAARRIPAPLRYRIPMCIGQKVHNISTCTRFTLMSKPAIYACDIPRRNRTERTYQTKQSHPTRNLSDGSENYEKTRSEVGDTSSEAATLTMKEKMKRAVKDYGATIIVFHVTLALSHYCVTYLAISSGFDLPMYLTKVGFSQELVQSKVMAGASNGLVAYAVYKLFAPVRIAITLSVAPLLVRYLRRRGILKPSQIVT